MKLLILILMCSVNQLRAEEKFISVIKDQLAVDPEYQESKLNIEIQKFTKYEAISEFALPDFNFTYSNLRDKSTSSSDESKYRYLSLSSSFSLFRFGADYYNLRSGMSSFELANINNKKNKLSRELELVELNLLLISKNEDVKIKNEIVDLKERLFELSKSKFRRGVLSKADLLKVEIDLINAQSEYSEALQNLAKFSNQYRSYFDSVPSLNRFPWTQQLKKIDINKVINTYVKEFVTPKVKVAQLQKEQSYYAYKSESLKHLGQFKLDYTRSLYRDEDDAYGYNVSVNYILPIFEKFSRQKRISQLRAQSEIARLKYRYESKLNNLEQSTIQENLILSAKNFKQRVSLLKTSQDLFASSSAQFKRGKLSVNELLIEQNRLLTTKILTNSAVFSMHLSYVRFLHSKGVSITEKKILF